ncbi:hypothetical protein [Pseudogemmobacter bohemicus]|uniref:hypothetical protein n=1 Tax=Pseudogemmobacter bohemicus TaxID=2250708 RepID=UPI000DD35F32|nr:hypothetical protein [Pseudogemmobacter bohemicus]
MATVIDTKIHPPLLRARLLRREAALALMDQALSHPLTLIRAPAGFGKSTLVAQWGAGLQEAGFAWLSLDPMADSGRSFILHLIRAVQRALPLADPGLERLTGSESFSPTRALAALVDAVQAAVQPTFAARRDQPLRPSPESPHSGENGPPRLWCRGRGPDCDAGNGQSGG